MDPQTVIIIILNGFYYAFALFIIAIALNILFGLMKILNIAHGGFYAIGAFLTWYLMIMAGDAGYPIYIIWLCIPAGAFLTGLTAFVVEPLIFKRLYKLREEYSLLATFGLMIILDDILRMIFGAYPVSANQLFNWMGTIKIFGSPYPAYNFAIYGFAIAVSLGLWAPLSRAIQFPAMEAAGPDYVIELPEGKLCATMGASIIGNKNKHNTTLLKKPRKQL